MNPKKICILGAGLSGLTKAWKHDSNGHQVKVIESTSRLGGVLQSKRTSGYLLDFSANTLSLRSQSTLDLLEEMGVLKYSIEANQKSNKRYVVRNGNLIALPRSISSFLKSPFLSCSGKLRILLEPFLAKGNPDAKESIASFVARRLGKEVLDYAVNPFIAGVFASRPETLNTKLALPSLYSMEQNDRSLLLGVAKKFIGRRKTEKAKLLSFPEGMNQLTQIIISSMKKVTFETENVVKKITWKHGSKHWEVTTQSKDGMLKKFECEELISALPADRISDIDWENINEAEHLDSLTSVTQFPICLAYFGLDASAVKHPLDGFGFLVPEKENLSILGTLFSSTLFPDRAPHGKVLLTTFVGGERAPDLALTSESNIFKVVQKDLQKTIGVKAEPEFKYLKRWRNGIPLPDHKMQIRRDAALALSRSNPGLHFSGSAFSGVSLPNCLDG